MIKYDIFKNAAFAAQNGVINDSRGTVSYAIKNYKDIKLENLSNTDNKNFLTPKNESIINAKPVSEETDCFYATFSEKSVYRNKATKEIMTEPSSHVYKIKLENDAIFALEIRNNDPLYIPGLDTPTYLMLQSIAISENEAAIVKNLIEYPNFSKSPTHLFFYGDIVTVKNSGNRPYGKVNLGVSGSIADPSTGKNKRHELDTNIVLHSLDGNNWISEEYAKAAFDIIAGYVWDNQIIPEPIGDNPFASYWFNGSTGLKDRLRTIITEADIFSVADDDKGSRLLDTPIRDYIYQGDIERITFEMAFRLPFYMENITKTPYTKVKIGGIERNNNPYYTKFDDWFGYANGLRAAAGFSESQLLSRTGHKKSFTDAIQGEPDHLNLYMVFNIGRNASFETHKVPAYMGKVMEDENAFSTYESKKNNIIHFPANYSFLKTTYKVPDNGGTLGYVLDYLERIGKISPDNNHEIKNYFLESPVNSFKNILDANSTNGYYIVKDTNNSLFIIHNIKITSVGNASGCTIGIGYDIGQHSNYNKFISYTEFSIINNTDKAVFIEIMGKQKEVAAALYESYKTTVLNKYKLPYDTAVRNAIPFMKDSFIIKGLNNNKGRMFFKIQGANNNYFCDPDAVPYLNEVGKMIFLSQLYNGGENILKTNRKRANLLIHSFNTHDYRWLKYYTIRPSKEGLSVYTSRKTALIKFMRKVEIYNHYNTKRSSL